METKTSISQRIELIWVLVTVQAAIAVVSTIESAFALLGFGPAVAPITILSATGAMATFLVARGLLRQSRRAYRWARRLERGWLVIAAFDLILALVFTRRGLGLTPTLVRIALPATILRLLGTTEMREIFGAKSSRRQRRKIRRSAIEVTS